MTAGILGAIVAGLSAPDAIRFAGLVPLAIGAVVVWRARRAGWRRIAPGAVLAGLGLLILVAA